MWALTEAGFGLPYDELGFGRTTEGWISAGSELRDRVASSLGILAAGVEHVGSSSVLGLLAKPIVDLAVGLSTDHELATVTKRREAAGWIYRGNAPDSGATCSSSKTGPGTGLPTCTSSRTEERSG